MTRRGLLLVVQVSLPAVLGALALGVTAASGDTGPPVSTDIPALTGSPGVGKTLTTTSGSWSTSATFAYQWLRCSKTFTDCEDITGATATSYTIRAADVGHVLAARVTATNADGSASAVSSGKGLVEGRAPGAKAKPWVRGTKKVGHTIYEVGPGWTRSPYAFRDQWLRCSAEGNACVRITAKVRYCHTCKPVSSGISADYKLTARDLGHRLRVRVTAWNGAGRSTSTSAPTRIVTR